MINLRYWLLIFFFIVVWFIIVIRLFVVNVINHEYYEKFAEKNITKTEVLVPMRGLIFDRNTEPLAINEIGFSISLIPKIRNSRIVESEIERIISFLPSLDKEELFNLYKKK